MKFWAIASCALLVSTAYIQAVEIPEPTFRIGFEDTALPDHAAGAKEHPSLKTDNLRYVDGKSGKAVLLGECPPLVYQATGNVPDEATITFWVKPLDWQKIARWRYLLVLSPRGRAIMYLAQYPRKEPVLQFLWTPVYSPGHETTDSALKVNEWNHVAVAWDGIRSRVYFNGSLVLSKQHPGGFQPNIPARATLQLGGLDAKASSGSSYQNAPWGTADTAVDDLNVYPGALSATQIAYLAGRTENARPLTAAPEQPAQYHIPKRATAPTLDGHLADGEWNTAATMLPLIDANRPGHTFDSPPQQIHLAYDDTHLYAAMRSVFPIGAQIPKGGTRRDLEAPDEQVWDDESFELWILREGEERTYRFAGNAAGGFTEMLGKDYAWTGKWQIANTMRLNIYGNETWEVELAIPWKTLGLKAGDGTELKLNFCRTWRCLDQLGVTSLAGAPGYPETAFFPTVTFTPTAPPYTITTSGTPSAGDMTQTFTFHNPAATPLNARLNVVLEADVPERNQTVIETVLNMAPGVTRDVEVAVNVTDTIHQRLAYSLTRDDGLQLLQASIPFELRADFLDVIPLLSEHAVVVRPAVRLYTSRLQATGADVDRVALRLLGPRGQVIVEQNVTENAEVRLALPEAGPWGEYRVQLLGLGKKGPAEPSERRFMRSEPPVWLTQRDDVMDQVLPPFTALETKRGPGNTVTIGCWGRTYQFGERLLPVSVASAGVPELLTASMALLVDGEDVGQSTLKLKSESPVRSELEGTAETAQAAISHATWVEYDGVVFHEIAVRAKTAIRDVCLRVSFRREHAEYAHFASGGFGAGGGFTRKLTTPLKTGFYPVVWLGDFERGLAWFCEGGVDMAPGRPDPILITPRDDTVDLRVQLLGKLAAGTQTTIRFGFMATPVKPLHPRYPLNVFTRDALWDQPPRIPAYCSVIWNPYNFFQDIPFYDPATKTMRTADTQIRETLQDTPTKHMPYMTPYTLTSEYQEAMEYRREWELVPVRHNDTYTRPVGAGETRPWTELWMSPNSESYRRFYAWKFGDALRRTGMSAVYFDFGCAMRDSNAHHGGRGGYCLLGMRDFYRRIVNEFVKAGVEDYAIIAHNSQAVQIPALSFVTHFYSGEHLRTSSSPTLHEGRDYLDTLPLHYFGIEQSGLPWGIHGNMLVEFDEAEHLVKRLGVTDETVTEYLWNRTPSVVMPILLHGCLPDGYRLSLPYYKSIVATLDAFDVPSATFHPYWRNQDQIRADHADVRISAYARPESPRVLLVVGNLNRESVETTVTCDLSRFYDGWASSPLKGMKRVAKKGELLQVVERVGARDAKIVEVGPNQVKLWIRGHGMALVEVAGHIRIR